MSGFRSYVSISEDTVEAAAKRAFESLNELTDGKAPDALQAAKEHFELCDILEKMRQDKAKEIERQQQERQY